MTHESNQDKMNLLHLNHAVGPLYRGVPHLWIQMKTIERNESVLSCRVSFLHIDTV